MTIFSSVLAFCMSQFGTVSSDGSGKKWLATGTEALLDQGKLWRGYLNTWCTVLAPATTAELTHIPDCIRTELGNLVDALDDVVKKVKALDGGTGADKVAMRQWEKKLREHLMLIKSSYIEHHMFPVEKLPFLNLKPHNKKPTPADKEVKWLVEIILSIAGMIRVVLLDYKIKGSVKSRARPPGCILVVRYAVFASPFEQITLDQLVHEVEVWRRPHELPFTDEDRGKHVAVAVAWKKKGKIGKWTDVKWHMVP